MIIQISETYRIKSHRYGWDVQNQRFIQSKTTGKKYGKWESISYHTTREGAVSSLVKLRIRLSKATSLAMGIIDAENIIDSMCQALDIKLEGVKNAIKGIIVVTITS